MLCQWADRVLREEVHDGCFTCGHTCFEYQSTFHVMSIVMGGSWVPRGVMRWNGFVKFHIFAFILSKRLEGRKWHVWRDIER